jgi:hypothetical protein
VAEPIRFTGWGRPGVFPVKPGVLAYFAFDLLHLNCHDLRPCPIRG